MQRNSLTPIKEESSLSDSKKTPSVRSANVLVLEPNYCSCARFFRDVPKGKDPCDDKSYSSILDKPFWLRRDESLNRAVKLQERNLQLRYSTLEPVEEAESTMSSTITIESLTSSATNTTSTVCTPSVHKIVLEHKQLDYLTDLEQMTSMEEISLPPDEISEKEMKGQEVVTYTEAMRLAQKYLKIHKIFELFQFLIAHLLARLPENPITFLLDLLDKCIVHRAGMGTPPLLYEQKHIAALFDLMDPMRTGYIDLRQYATGMKTLGICSFKRYPPLNNENMVSKQIFVEEAFENLIHLLDDVIKRRWIDHKFGGSIAPLTTPPPTSTHLTPGDTPRRTTTKLKSEKAK